MPVELNSDGAGAARRFIEIFRLAARQAGCMALRLQDEVGLRVKAGESTLGAAALTSVDLAAQDILLLALHAAFPDAAVDAEEKTASADLFPPQRPGGPLIVVDPLDGTLNYAGGSRDYAIMGAWIEEDRCLAALIHFPFSGESWWARRGRGAFVQHAGGESVPVAIGRLPERILVTSGVPTAWHADLEKAGFEMAVSHCSAVDATAPLTGRAAGAISMGRPDRRRAIGFLPTVEGGGSVWTGDRWWQGEDPAMLADDAGVTLVAGTHSSAARIAAALKRHQTAGIGRSSGVRWPRWPRPIS